MSFVVDKQTLDDLNILGKFKAQSIFSFFNHTRTRGGERLLESMFRSPLSQVKEINARAEVIAFFSSRDIAFPISSALHDQVGDYLRRAASANILISYLDILRKKAGQSLGITSAYEPVCQGVNETLEYLHLAEAFLSELLHCAPPEGVKVRWTRALSALNEGGLASALKKRREGKLRFREIAYLDYIFRSSGNNTLLHLLEILVEIDVYCTAGTIAAQHQLSFARAAEDAPGLEVQGFYHLGITGAVPNALSLKKGNNVLFLTGANMAGKSTLMKSFSVVVYLAHMGFPVPARSVRFVPYEGMYTSINVSDNIDSGYSHFYAEVMRIKQVAQEVAAGKRLLVVFDELFKGTNVKDAYEASVAVIQAFSKYRRCSFILSTHITEAGALLRQSETHFQFGYMPTKMEDGIPQYSYTMQPGISEDRHGMVIISNERILETIRGTG